MKMQRYSHLCNAQNWEDKEISPLVDALVHTQFNFHNSRSLSLRRAIQAVLRSQGWSSKVKLIHSSKISITATNGQFGLCLQTGNMSRFYADLLKLQYLFQKGTIKAAVYILLTKHRAQEMGSNLAHYERFVEELDLFSEIITVPLFVIGID